MNKTDELRSYVTPLAHEALSREEVAERCLAATHEDALDFLSRCDDDLLRFIELQLGFAKDVRAYQLEYGISNKEFAREYGCDLEQVSRLRQGSTDITIKDMARLRTLYACRIAKANANVKIVSE